MANTAKSMIDLARSQIGYREGPRDNENKFSKETPTLGWSDRMPWCQTFISWLAWKTGNKDVIPTTAACATCTNYYKQRGQFHTSNPKPGDLVMYGAGGGTHVDMVTEVGQGRIRVIGGNTGGNLAGTYWNGNGVYEKWVTFPNSRIHGFGRPKYKAGSTGGGGGTQVLPDPGVGKPPTKGKWKIKKGQTLTGIAALLGVSLAALLAANPDVKDPNKIEEGQELNIPGKGKETSKPDPNKGTSKPKPDPVTGISPKPKPPTKPVTDKVTTKPTTGVKPSGKPSTTHPDKGGVVTSGKPTSKPVTGATKKYTIVKGDTLWGIAVKHGITLKQLLAMNPDRFPNPNLIFAGQHVNLSGSTIKVPDTINKDHCTCNKVKPTQPKPSKPVTPAKPKPKPAPVTGNVSLSALIPNGPVGAQADWDRPLTAQERENARIILQEAIKAFGPTDGPRAAVIGIATAYQESRLVNIKGGHLDSAGLFQQRPSMGWGSFAQVTDPHYSAAKFFSTMKELAPGWKGMTLWEASHKVQRSGNPMIPARFERAAAQLVVQLAGGTKDSAGDRTKVPPRKQVEPTKRPQSSGTWMRPVDGRVTTVFGQGGSMWSSGAHTGVDFAMPMGSPVSAAGAGKVESAGWAGAYGNAVVIDHGNGKKTRYAHLSRMSLSPGMEVSKGDLVGAVGTTGNSTGPHLHWELIANGQTVDPMRLLNG
jgi:murein DD-endopeptidase MepM/ murein hydrolase activator NlpD